MKTSEQVYKGSIIELNHEIEALDRLSRLFYRQIEKWETADPLPQAELRYLQENHKIINDKIAVLLQKKVDMGLPL